MKKLIFKCDKCGEQVEQKEQVEITINTNHQRKVVDLCKECAVPYVGMLNEICPDKENPEFISLLNEYLNS